MVRLYCYYLLVSNNSSQKLGQLFFIGFQGYTLSKQIRNFLKQVQPGGIVFFECNIKDKKQVKKLIAEINSLIKIKPFIAVDQEGGSVERLRKICTSVPSLWGLSKVGLKELLTAQKIIALELKELGFNMNLSPVLDINSNPNNPIIGTRALSDNSNTVSKYGLEIVKLFLKYKIIPVVKHFPGHGDLNIDSHLSLPILNKTKTELNKFELIPFKEAIKNNVPAIMVGHIQLPYLEPDKVRPATLSKNILESLLRKELKYKGLIITDELNMKGVTKNFTLQNATYESLTAGADMVLFNWEENKTIKAFNYVLKKASRNKELIKRIDESYKRVIALKNRNELLGLRNKQNKFNSQSSILNPQFFLSSTLADKVIHWIKRDLFFQPIHKSDLIEIIYPITPKLRSEDLLDILNGLGLKNHKLVTYELNPSTKDIRKIFIKSKKSNRKILITYDIAARKKQKQLALELFKNSNDLIVISVGLEHDIELIPQVKNLIAAYAPNYISLLVAFKKLT